MKTESIRGRGTAANPGNRFETVHYDPVGHEGYEYEPDEDPSPQTQFFRDNSKSILTHNDSPDVGFDTSINSYRGCEHGCAYRTIKKLVKLHSLNSLVVPRKGPPGLLTSASLVDTDNGAFRYHSPIRNSQYEG